MAFQHCENRSCGRLFDSEHPGQFFCSTECRAQRHAQLLRTPCSEAKTLAPAPRPTTSVREAWVQAGSLPQPDEVDRYADMLKRAILIPAKRPDLSSARPRR